MADTNDVAAGREWVALQATALKASKVMSAQLADNEKLMVPAGTRLSALLAGEDADHWLVKEATIRGVAIANKLGYIFKGHWKFEGAGDKGVFEPIHQQVTATLADYAENRGKHRRLYAAFRRRQSHR